MCSVPCALCTLHWLCWSEAKQIISISRNGILIKFKACYSFFSQLSDSFIVSLTKSKVISLVKQPSNFFLFLSNKQEYVYMYIIWARLAEVVVICRQAGRLINLLISAAFLEAWHFITQNAISFFANQALRIPAHSPIYLFIVVMDSQILQHSLTCD